jgi:pimeloyl-ACP methyl ester carboxylesterase
MPLFEHAGATLHYTVSGEGPPLVLLHGFGSSEVDWELQRPALVAQFQVITPDLRGFGQSSREQGPFSIEQFAEDFRALLAHLQIERFSLLGYSLGGAVAFEFAVNAPERVERLILVNTWPSFRTTTWKKKRELMLRKAVVRFMGLEKMAKVLGKRLFPEEDQAHFRATFEERYAQNDKAVYLAMLKAIPTWSVREQLGVLDMPTLVVGAEFDYTPFAEKEAYVVDLPNAQLVKIIGSRHGTPVDRAEELNGLVLEFLEA